MIRQSSRPTTCDKHANEEISPASTAHGILDSVNKIEQRRRANDIIYRLLTNADETELIEHIAGLLQPTTGLLRRKYTSLEAPRYKPLLERVASMHNDTSVGVDQRRTSYHFVMFVAMATECDFMAYLLRGVWDRERFRTFVTQRLQRLFVDALEGNMTITSTPLETFVSVCRCEYMLHCLPTPPPDCAPELNLRVE